MLLIVNADSKVYVDGDEKGKVHANDAFKMSMTKGQHYIQAKGKWNGQESETHQTVDIESDGQTIVNLSFTNETKSSGSKADPNSKLIADLSFKLPGTIAVNEWKSHNPGKNYPDYPTYYYAFEKGDEIVINFKNPGSKTTNKILVYSYPARETKYSNNSFTELNDIHIKVEERTIYIFEIGTNHAFSGNGELLISRVPSSESTASFNTNVTRKKVYHPVYVQATQEFTIHSATHITGSNKEIVPIALPANTVKWFYKFSASRNKSEMAQVKDGLKLFDEIVSMCGTEGKVTAACVNLLSTPPGSDNCDVYLLDEQNHVLFNNNTNFQYTEEGTRTGLMSGKLEINSAIGQTYYLGIVNPSTFYAINVVVEVVAITQKEELVMDQQ